jgi:hypothetical protein
MAARTATSKTSQGWKKPTNPVSGDMVDRFDILIETEPLRSSQLEEPLARWNRIVDIQRATVHEKLQHALLSKENELHVILANCDGEYVSPEISSRPKHGSSDSSS